MADISKIKLLDNVTYNLKDANAIRSNTDGNTQNLRRPLKLNGTNDITIDAKINTLRANRLAFLPASQIIIEKTTDGGATWVDAQVSDDTKLGLFSEVRSPVYIPQIDGVRNLLCGIRVTITAMRYDVPANTPETQKYNYWNSDYVLSAERYNQIKEMYFWVSSVSDTISVKVERATGGASTTWLTVFDQPGWGMTGWSGNDYIRLSSQGVFGGGTNQTGNYWNYRITFMTRGVNGTETMNTTSTTQSQSIMEIRGYGDTWWTAGNNYAANDHMYTFDKYKNVTFPAKVTATEFAGSGASLTSLNYNNISNKPTIPTKTSQLTNDSGFVTQTSTDGLYVPKSIDVNNYITFQQGSFALRIEDAKSDNGSLNIGTYPSGQNDGESYFRPAFDRLELHSLIDPTNDRDAVHKKYVDDIVGDIETLLAAI